MKSFLPSLFFFRTMFLHRGMWDFLHTWLFYYYYFNAWSEVALMKKESSMSALLLDTSLELKGRYTINQGASQPAMWSKRVNIAVTTRWHFTLQVTSTRRHTRSTAQEDRKDRGDKEKGESGIADRPTEEGERWGDGGKTRRSDRIDTIRRDRDGMNYVCGHEGTE